MATPRRTRRPRTTLLILALLSITIITLDARGSLHKVTSGLQSVTADAFSPVRSLSDAITEPIGSFLAGSVHYGAVREQNQKLLAEIGALRQHEEAAADNAAALQQLTALLHLPFVGNLQSVPAQVINYGTTNFVATITIDMGRSDGVQLGMPVVGAGGLVGQVVAASHHTATIRLITDGDSVVGVRYAGTQLAVLNGQGWGRPLAAGLIPADTPLATGQVFVTSGLQDAAYPPGIPVPTVASARSGVTASEESVVLQPSADLAHLRYVSVLLWGPSS